MEKLITVFLFVSDTLQKNKMADIIMNSTQSVLKETYDYYLWTLSLSGKILQNQITHTWKSLQYLKARIFDENQRIHLPLKPGVPQGIDWLPWNQ